MEKLLILGSSGLVGSHLLKLALEDPYFKEVIIWVRKPVSLTHEKLKVVITDFKILPQENVDILFSCLGTTRKKTPNLTEYEFIEVNIPINVSRMLLPTGLRQMHYISSLGVSPSAKGFYLKLKNKAETELSDLSIPNLNIYRPSLIVGKRTEKRLFENISHFIFKIVNPLLLGSLKKFRSIDAETIAKAMIAVAKSKTKGTHVFESDEIQIIGR